MEEIEAKVKKWGNSYGVIIPKNLIESQNLSENSEIVLTIKSKRSLTVRDAMAMSKKYGLKSNKNIKESIKKMDFELYGIKR